MMMTVVRRSLHGIVSDGRVLGILVPLPLAVLTGFPQGASISLEGVLAKLCFPVLCHRVSLTVTKYPDILPRSIRPL